MEDFFMKLIYAIVNNDDTYAVSNGLVKSHFYATKLASTGGFLKAGNTTFLIATEDDKVQEVIDIIKATSRKRKQFVPSTVSSEVNFPVEVSVGGATIIVTDIDRFEKV